MRNFDFLSLKVQSNKYHKRIMRVLQRYKENLLSPDTFSDYTQKVDTSFQKHKRILLVTDDALYQLSTNLSVMVRIPLVEINAVTLIRKSSVLAALHCPYSYDHLLEVFRRTEFVMFLMHVFDKRQFKRPTVYYADGLKISNSDKAEMMRFDPGEAEEKTKTAAMLRELQSNNFVNAAKFGYLQKRSESWFKSWTEKFCVLTNVGLLYYITLNKSRR